MQCIDIHAYPISVEGSCGVAGAASLMYRTGTGTVQEVRKLPTQRRSSKADLSARIQPPPPSASPEVYFNDTFRIGVDMLKI